MQGTDGTIRDKLETRLIDEAEKTNSIDDMKPFFEAASTIK